MCEIQIFFILVNLLVEIDDLLYYILTFLVRRLFYICLENLSFYLHVMVNFKGIMGVGDSSKKKHKKLTFNLLEFFQGFRKYRIRKEIDFYKNLSVTKVVAELRYNKDNLLFTDRKLEQ